MYGLEAITTHNGWSMAMVGAAIVFSGLVVLSLAISQLKKLIALWENRNKQTLKNGMPDENTEAKGIELPEHWPEDIHEAASLYEPLFKKLGDSFPLSDLYTLSKKNNYPHPHLTIKRLREAQILIPVGDGNFTQNQSNHDENR
ncbi:MAG: OadG family protein [Desulfobacterales bacterium]